MWVFFFHMDISNILIIYEIQYLCGVIFNKILLGSYLLIKILNRSYRYLIAKNRKV